MKYEEREKTRRVANTRLSKERRREDELKLIVSLSKKIEEEKTELNRQLRKKIRQ